MLTRLATTSVQRTFSPALSLLPAARQQRKILVNLCFKKPDAASSRLRKPSFKQRREQDHWCRSHLASQHLHLSGACVQSTGIIQTTSKLQVEAEVLRGREGALEKRRGTVAHSRGVCLEHASKSASSLNFCNDFTLAWDKLWTHVRCLKRNVPLKAKRVYARASYGLQFSDGTTSKRSKTCHISNHCSAPVVLERFTTCKIRLLAYPMPMCSGRHYSARYLTVIGPRSP
eukprot:1294243-Pleurochrysis_carterae.AAC.1